MSFKDFWLGTGGVSGNYDFGMLHILSMVLMVVLTVALCFWGMKKEGAKRKIVLAIAWTQFSFEILWRVVYLIRGSSFLDLYPFYPCNLNGILVPLAAIINNVRMKKMFYFFGIIGAILTFAMPNGIFTNKFLNFSILKSILQHTGLFILPIIESCFKTFKIKFKDLGWTFLGVLICLFNSEVMPLIFKLKNYDFMFFRSGLPFVIDGVPQWITFSIFGAIVIVFLGFFVDIKGALALRKKNKFETIL